MSLLSKVKNWTCITLIREHVQYAHIFSIMELRISKQSNDDFKEHWGWHLLIQKGIKKSTAEKLSPNFKGAQMTRDKNTARSSLKVCEVQSTNKLQDSSGPYGHLGMGSLEPPGSSRVWNGLELSKAPFKHKILDIDHLRSACRVESSGVKTDAANVKNVVSSSTTRVK